MRALNFVKSAIITNNRDFENSISHEYLLSYHETLFANVFKINPRVVLTQELTDIRTFSKKTLFWVQGRFITQ